MTAPRAGQTVTMGRRFLAMLGVGGLGVSLQRSTPTVGSFLVYLGAVMAALLAALTVWAYVSNRGGLDE